MFYQDFRIDTGGRDYHGGTIYGPFEVFVFNKATLFKSSTLNRSPRVFSTELIDEMLKEQLDNLSLTITIVYADNSTIPDRGFYSNSIKLHTEKGTIKGPIIYIRHLDNVLDQIEVMLHEFRHHHQCTNPEMRLHMAMLSDLTGVDLKDLLEADAKAYARAHLHDTLRLRISSRDEQPRDNVSKVKVNRRSRSKINK